MTAKLLVKQGGRILTDLATNVPSDGIISVGSDASSTIRLGRDSIAPEHFVIVCEGERLTLLARAEGVTVNDESLASGSLHDIVPGDVVKVSEYEFSFGPESQPSAGIEDPFSRKLEADAPDPAATDEPEHPMKFEGGLSEVLSNLRGEERFYFLIENGSGAPHRVYVDNEEMWLGWSPSGKCVLSVDTTEIAMPRAQIRKDWSGVVLYPLQMRGILLEDQFVSDPHRLKNNELFSLLSADGKRIAPDVQIRFHEPTALLVLNSILPKELPPPVPLGENSEPVKAIETVSVSPQSTVSPPQGKYLLFGYFTVTEVLTLILGTIVTAILTFLILVLF